VLADRLFEHGQLARGPGLTYGGTCSALVTVVWSAASCDALMYDPEEPLPPPDAVADEPHAAMAGASAAAMGGAPRGPHVFAEILID